MKVFVFDLDFTLWNAGGTWCDGTTPPYKWVNGKLIDSCGARICLYDDVIEILELLKSKNKIIVAASRTYEPDWANSLLDLLGLNKYFDLKEIYPSTKTIHFKTIQKHFQIPYSQMVFFDDEYRNIREVSALGVEVVYVKNGLNLEMIYDYL